MAESSPEPKDEILPTRGFAETWHMFMANRAALLGLILWTFVMVVAFIGPLLYPLNPFDMAGAPMTPPGREFPLGTDYLGRDVLAGIVQGARVTLFIGFSATAFTVIIGILIGVFAGFYGKWVETALMRVTEFFQVLPALLLSMALIALFSPSLGTIIIGIGIVNWPPVARLARAEFLRVKGLEFVMAERAIGAQNRRIMWRIILPNSLPPLIVASTLSIASAILFEASLSFLGLGDPNMFSWGYMIGASRDYIWDTWWVVTFSGLAIFFTVLSISLIGDGLNDALNPKLRLQ
jgi:peptide/nickel transport system permease protein